MMTRTFSSAASVLIAIMLAGCGTGAPVTTPASGRKLRLSLSIDESFD